MDATDGTSPTCITHVTHLVAVVPRRVVWWDEFLTCLPLTGKQVGVDGVAVDGHMEFEYGTYVYLLNKFESMFKSHAPRDDLPLYCVKVLRIFGTFAPNNSLIVN